MHSFFFASSLTLLAASLWMVATTTAQSTVSLAPDAQPTSGASGLINPSFAGFGIESSNLYSFTGGSTENKLSTNLLQNLADYTGAPPHLRIGGNTQDQMIYKSSMTNYEVERNPNPVGQGNIPTDTYIIGPTFFEVLSRWPSGTPITFGLSLAYSGSDYIPQIVTLAEAAWDGLKNLALVSFEIGNEPDLYLGNGFRTGAWDGVEYTQQWLERAAAVWSQVLNPIGATSNFFEPACTASTIGTSFLISDLANDGITVIANGSSLPYVKSWNQHDYYYYIGVSTYPLTMADFLYLPNTNQQFAVWVGQIQEAESSDFPYALREMGVVGPIGMDGLTNVFAASLWTLNFFFYAATLNISSVQMHMTDNSNASAWQPINIYGSQPYVRPNYYAWAAFDQTIGPTCQARIGGYVLGQSGLYTGTIGSYAVYQNDILASIVLINTMMANSSQTVKNNLTIDLTLPTTFAGQTLYLAYLTADGADSKHGTTWNGISFEQSADGTPTVVDSTVYSVPIGNDGKATVQLRDSQALVANIGSPVGSRKINTSACAAMASTTPTSIANAAGNTGTSTGTDPAGSTTAGSHHAVSGTTNDHGIRFNMMMVGIVAAVMSHDIFFG